MNFSLKPHQLIAHWVPGFIALFIALFCKFGWEFQALVKFFNGSTLFLVAVAAFVVGQIIDAVRNVWIEDWKWLNRRTGNVDWDFFVHGKKDELSNSHEDYFDYYVFDVNAVLSLLLSAVVSVVIAVGRVIREGTTVGAWVSSIVPRSAGDWYFGIAVMGGVMIALYVLAMDALDLRKDIARFSKGKHDGQEHNR